MTLNLETACQPPIRNNSDPKSYIALSSRTAASRLNALQIFRQGALSLVEITGAAGIGCLCARAFTSISPIPAAVGLGVTETVLLLTKPIFVEHYTNLQIPPGKRLTVNVLHFGIGIAAGLMVSAKLGFPIAEGPLVAMIAMMVSLVGFGILIAGGSFHKIVYRV